MSQSNKERVDELKRSTRCAECEEFFPPECMDFDHVSGRKYANVSTLVRKLKPWAVIKAEIDKCEIVCANCHRTRTKNRMRDRYRELYKKFRRKKAG